MEGRGHESPRARGPFLISFCKSWVSFGGGAGLAAHREGSAATGTASLSSAQCLCSQRTPSTFVFAESEFQKSWGCEIGEKSKGL